ncbi:MAG: prepilin-type N-terminal cleavage/methylation domain-containing protein [Patescibacteria group bacterium]
MKAFTLIELLVVIGITAILAVFFIMSPLSFRSQQDLNLTVLEITAALRNAQDNSISQESGSVWGIYFDNINGSGFYDFFSGSNYSSTNIVSRSALRSNIKFVQPIVGASSTVIFNAVSGLPVASTTIIIVLREDSLSSRAIIINANGQIQH